MSLVSRPVPAPDARPDVWRGDALARGNGLAALPSGHAALDAQLPGGGWPAAGLVELLQVREALHDWQLLLPALARLSSPQRLGELPARAGPVALVGSPAGLVPFLPSLAAQGLPPERLLWIDTPEDAARLWAAEQALRCADVPAVLAWLPRVRSEALRRLHMAALDNAKPLFAFRPAGVRHQASAAPLRLLLDGTVPGRLTVEVFKRRGPPLAQPLGLAARGNRLAALLGTGSGGPWQESAHALDRAAVAA